MTSGGSSTPRVTRMRLTNVNGPVIELPPLRVALDVDRAA
jgi:hypothetical protein